MTDEVTSQSLTSAPRRDEKKDDKKTPSNGSAQAGRHPRRNMSRTASSGGANANPQRPSSRSSNKRTPSNAPAAAESGSESVKKGNEGKKPEQRKPSSSGNPRHRKGQQSSAQVGRQGNGGNRDASATRPPTNKPSSASPAPVAASDSSDALSSLQRVIQDLKTTSPPNQSVPIAAGAIGNTMSLPPNQGQVSSLPPNAPVFQPGAAAYPGQIPNNEIPPRHRKAASLGAGANPSAFNAFSPNLGSMMEDEEHINASFEEGEIQETPFQSAGHQRRSLSQSFTAPRFAALAAQEQIEPLGPTGRPQLAPHFMFGARRRPSAAMPIGPPINEEDLGFQFPQQQNQGAFNLEPEPPTRKADNSGEISGIMAEQVGIFVVSTVIFTDIAIRLLFRIRSKLSSYNSRRSTNSSSLRVKLCLSRRLA